MPKLKPILLSLLIASSLPLFAEDSMEWKKSVPSPVFSAQPEYVDLYWRAWEIAHDHVLEQEGVPQSPYMDEAFHIGSIWIWDTCFMALFCKYAPDEFPGVESFNNFYVPFLTDQYADGSYPLNIQHPDNPPLFAWAEYDNFLFTDDTAHANSLLLETQYLQKHFDWFEALEPGWEFQHKNGKAPPTCLKRTELGYQWGGCPSGMDNTPRAPHGLWIDAIAQQGLSALYISRMAARIGETEEAEKWKAKYEELKDLVNTHYWHEEDGIYYDISRDGKEFYKVKTPAAYWPLLAEMASPEQAKRMAEHIMNPEVFGGERPWVTVSRDSEHFNDEDGDYWRGGIWLPTAYMATKALEKYGYYREADDAANNLLAHMLRTYQKVEPHTIWECYSPMRDHPVIRKNGHQVREDFCGWSALGPISMFIENVLGFHKVDAQQRHVEWRLYQEGEHGLRNFSFGEVTTDIIFDGKETISVKSNAAYTLTINGKQHQIKEGENSISL